MSTKNNYFLKQYTFTKIFIDSIFLEEIENKLFLEMLAEKARLAEEEKARLEEEERVRLEEEERVRLENGEPSGVISNEITEGKINLENTTVQDAETVVTIPEILIQPEFDVFEMYGKVRLLTHQNTSKLILTYPHFWEQSSLNEIELALNQHLCDNYEDDDYEIFRYLSVLNQTDSISTDMIFESSKLCAGLSEFFKLYNKIYKGLLLKHKKKFKKIKRRVRKFRKFRKLVRRRKMSFHLARHNYEINTLFIDRISNTPDNILLQRISLTQRSFNNSNLELFYKFNKDLRWESKFYPLDKNSDEEYTIFLRNYHKQPYWKFRLARILHWKMFTRKTLRKQRYKSFSESFIKKYHKISDTQLMLINFFTKFSMSWTRTKRLYKFLKQLITYMPTNNLVFLPMFYSNVINWNFFSKRAFVSKKIVSRWSYLNYKRAVCPWLQRKKNFPKRIKHLLPNFVFFKSITQYDPTTNYLFITKKLVNYSLPFTEQFKINYLTKLHMYRYKATMYACYLMLYSNLKEIV